MEPKSITLDTLDHQLIHALQLDGRVPFARFAQLVGVSEQTVARRFRRLRAAGVVRVYGLVDPLPLGESSWTVRIQSRPGAAVPLADALARRPDVSWVNLTSGGSEIICVARSRTSAQRDELLLQRLPKTAQVIGFSAQALLHRFDPPTGWTTGLGQLDPAQVESLLSQAIGGGPNSGDPRPAVAQGSAVTLSAPDEAMLAVLAMDGRAPAVRLAEVTGWTPARVNRRLDELVRSGLLYFDADLALKALGFGSTAVLWLTVAAADLASVGARLATHDVVTFAAATTGASNLMGAVACRDTAHLYQYVTEGLGSLGPLRQLEVSPILRRVKQGGSMMDGDRLLLA
jgi:DNA-binding Lrp family transcriptional regulator